MIKLTHNKKPSKDEALEIVAALHNGDALTQAEKDSLLLYFKGASNPKKPKTVEEWVGLAASKHVARPAIKYMYVENNVIYATDGFIVFWGPTHMIDGFYDPKTQLVVDVGDLRFPNVKRVIDSIKVTKSHTSDVLDDFETVIVKGNECLIHSDLGCYASNDMNKVKAGGLVEICKTTHGDRISGHTGFGSFVVTGFRV